MFRIILEETLAEGSLEISEMSEGGRILELKMIDKSAGKSLVTDGEELVGAKQNGAVNATLLIPAHAEGIVPVS